VELRVAVLDLVDERAHLAKVGQIGEMYLAPACPTAESARRAATAMSSASP
jgi:hypothetical protein